MREGESSRVAFFFRPEPAPRLHLIHRIVRLPSAAMVIVKKGGGVYLKNDIVLRLQVDDNPEPIKELRRLVEKSAEWRKRVTTVR